MDRDTWTHGYLLSAIVGGELQQHDLPVSTSTSMCPCPCPCPWTRGHGQGHMDQDIVSATVGGELQQHLSLKDYLDGFAFSV